MTVIPVRRYLAGSDVFSDFSCQKKLVCEVYWESDDLGELSSRGAHGLDLVLAGASASRFVTLPQPVTNALEEFKVHMLEKFRNTLFSRNITKRAAGSQDNELDPLNFLAWKCLRTLHQPSIIHRFTTVGNWKPATYLRIVVGAEKTV